MIFMGLNGFGLSDATDNYTACLDVCTQKLAADDSFDFDGCSNSCQSTYNTEFAAENVTGGSAGSTSSASSGGGTSWWEKLATAVAGGAATGLKPGMPGPTGVKKTAVTTPWYLTPPGIILLIVGIGGGAYLLARR